MSYTHFKQNERDEIAILLKKGYSLRDIGHALRRSPSSVSREINRNLVKGEYDPRKARVKAYVRRKKSKYQGMKIRDILGLEEYVEAKMRSYWTPEQIAGRLKAENGETVISAKSIYEYVYSPYGQHLTGFLTYKQNRKRNGATKRKSWNSGCVKNRVFIDDRPDIVNQRARFGDFEADTLGVIRTDKEVLTGIAERLSRFLMIKKVSRLKYAVDGFKESLNPYQSAVQSITFDNGIENRRHLELNTSTFFCHPYSSWEKGTIENLFGRLRRFIPKKTSLRHYSPEHISAIMDIMNNTPRKCLEYRTPAEVFNEQFDLNRKNQCCS